MPKAFLFLLAITVLLAGCNSPDSPSSDATTAGEPDAAPMEVEADVEATGTSEAAMEETESDDWPRAVLSSLEDSLFAEIPELAECREMISEDMSGMRGEATREKGFANIITIPCGPAPGTGAYGFPLSMVAEYEAMQNTPEGDVEKLWIPIGFSDLSPDGEVISTGYITQAIPNWTEDHLADGRFHLLYKYAGAGQCGRLVTYETPAWRAGFPFWEVREQSCDEEGTADPLAWDVVFDWEM